MPKKYRVAVIERWERNVEVEADSIEEARRKAADAASNDEGHSEFHSDTPSENWSVFDLETEEYVG